MHDGGSLASRVRVSLRRQGILLRQFRICSKTAVQQMPAVPCVLPVQIREMIIVLVARKDAVVGALGDFPAVLQRAEFLGLCSSSARYQHAWRIGGFFGDDVDDPIYRIGAPDRPARSADHLNSFNGIKWHLLLLPLS